MKIEAFGVEQWMNEWETKCAYNVAETCVESITVKELLELAGVSEQKMTADLLDKKLTYGWIEGSTKVRELIAQKTFSQRMAASVRTCWCMKRWWNPVIM